MKSFGVLGFVALIFVGAALAFKKAIATRNGSQRGVMGAISRFAAKNFGTQGKMIEVVANHYLGPKKQIAVVKIGNRQMVLGVTPESINLIAQMPVEMGAAVQTGNSADAALSDAMLDQIAEKEAIASDLSPDHVFAAILGNQTQTQPQVQVQAPVVGPTVVRNYSAPNLGSGAMAAAPAPVQNGSIQSGSKVRDRIRSRLEGMKQL